MYESPPGVKPFAGHRQRLDRYDENDFDSYVAAIRPMGLWLVDDASQAEQHEQQSGRAPLEAPSRALLA